LSEPKYGEVWQGVAKDPANARRKTDEILELVTARLE
jgi:pre-mRNA-processing factor 6